MSLPFGVQMNVLSVGQLLAALMGLIMCGVLLRINRGVRRYDFLIVFVGLLVLDLFYNFSIETKLILECPSLIYINEPLNMLFGLFLFLYVRRLCRPNTKMSKSDMVLFIPFVISILNYLPFYMLSPADKLNDFILYGDFKSDLFDSIYEWGFEVTINFAFLWYALKILRSYNYSIKQQLSDVQLTGLHITRVIIKACMGIYIIEILLVYITLFGFPYYKELLQLSGFIEIIFLVLIGYDAIVSHKYINLLREEWIQFPAVEQNIGGKIVKYAKSGLTEESSEKIKLKLLEFMDKKKPYLESNLKINKLSESTGIPSQHISQVINESFGKNFYEFVNEYRVKAAIILLREYEYRNYTYTAIGFEVGFNSKSAFYNAFKKVTNTTPARYGK